LARFFPPLSDEMYRRIMELALFGELRRRPCRRSMTTPPPTMNDELPPWLSTKEAALKVALWLCR
jgi:hypothetical protein